MTGVRPERLARETTRLDTLTFLQSATLSPGSERLAYVLRRTAGDVDDVYELWTSSRDAEDARRQLVSGGRLGRPEWSPSGSMVACVGAPAAGETRAVLLIDTESSEVSAIASAGLVPSEIAWRSDGGELTGALASLASADPAAPVRIASQPWRLEGLGDIGASRTALFKLSPGRQPAPLLRLAHTAVRSRLTWSPDGRYLSYLESFRSDFEGAGINSPLPALCLWDSQTDTVLACTSPDWGWIVSSTWSADSSRIVFLGTPLEQRTISRYAAVPDLWSYDPVAQRLDRLPLPRNENYGVRLQADMPIDLDALFNRMTALPEGDGLLVPGQVRGRAVIWRVSAARGLMEVVSPDDDASYALVGVSYAGETAVVAARTTVTEPPELCAFPLTGGDGVRRLSRYNPDAGDGSKTVLRRTLAVSDEHAIDTWVHVPHGRRGPRPALLKVHGGPYGATGEIFSLDVAYLVARGYCVVAHNFRGSAGYGEAFAASISHDWGGIGEQDHLAAIRNEVDAGLADPDKLGVFGMSHGGFASCWLAGRSTTFKAAIAENPATDFYVQWGTSDVGSWFMPYEVGAAPYEDVSAYVSRSPTSFARDCRVPVLLIQGMRDLRCSPDQSLTFFMHLKAHRCPAELLLLPEGDHMGSVTGRAEYRRARIEATIAWFAEHLHGRSVTKEE